MDIKQALARVVDQIDLTTEEMQLVMRQIMTGQCTDAQVGGFLVALRMKSESIDEITGAAQVMRELASQVEIRAERLVDKEAVRERMPQVGHREVRLRHIGAPKDYRPSGSASPSSDSGSSKPRRSPPDEDGEDGEDDNRP